MKLVVGESSPNIDCHFIFTLYHSKTERFGGFYFTGLNGLANDEICCSALFFPSLVSQNDEKREKIN